MRRVRERRGRGQRVRVRCRHAVKQEALVEIRARRGPLCGHCNQNKRLSAESATSSRRTLGGRGSRGEGAGPGARDAGLVSELRTSCGGAWGAARR